MTGKRVRNCDIGRNVVKWGEGQTDAGVAQSFGRVSQIDPQLVQAMISEGLTLAWVKDQLRMYRNAEADPKKRVNKQVLPRIALLEAILRNWHD